MAHADKGKGKDDMGKGKGIDKGIDKGKGIEKGKDKGKGTDKGIDKGKGNDKGKGKDTPYWKCYAQGPVWNPVAHNCQVPGYKVHVRDLDHSANTMKVHEWLMQDLRRQNVTSLRSLTDIHVIENPDQTAQQAFITLGSWEDAVLVFEVVWEWYAPKPDGSQYKVSVKFKVPR